MVFKYLFSDIWIINYDFFNNVFEIAHDDVNAIVSLGLYSKTKGTTKYFEKIKSRN